MRRAFFLTLLLPLLLACSRSSSYETLVPADATLVAAADGSQLLSDSLTTDLLLHNLKDCGIDLQQPLLAFQTREGNQCVTVAVSDQARLQKALEQLAGVPMKDENGLLWGKTASEHPLQIVLSDQALLLMKPAPEQGEKRLKRTALALFQQEESQQFCQTERFAALADLQQTANFYIAPNGLQTLFGTKADVVNALLPEGLALRDFIADGTAQLNPTCACIDLQLHGQNEQANAFLDSLFSALQRPLEGRFISQSKPTDDFWLGISADGKRLWQQLKPLRQMALAAEQSSGLDLQALVEGISGDLTLCGNLPADSLQANMPLALFAQMRSGSAAAPSKTISLGQNSLRLQPLGSDLAVTMSGTAAKALPQPRQWQAALPETPLFLMLRGEALSQFVPQNLPLQLDLLTLSLAPERTFRIQIHTQ